MRGRSQRRPVFIRPCATLRTKGNNDDGVFMRNPASLFRRGITGLTAVAGLCLAAAVAPAVQAGPALEVQVLDQATGAPLAGAAVCLGTRAELNQFGAFRTDARGISRFEDLPRNPLLLTVSRPGYRGREQGLEPIAENRVLIVKLAAGGGGPTCAGAEGSGAVAAVGLALTAVEVAPDPVSDDPRRVVVKTRVRGKATDIRVSDSADFAAAPWRPYAPSVGFELNRAGEPATLYVQVRRYVKAGGATLETVSAVRRVRYPAVD